MVVLTLIGLTSSTSTHALPRDRSLDQCRFDVWTTRDGLPASEITSIAQTPDGFLWLATSSGLVRFDGSNFFLYDSSNTPGMTSDLVRSLAVDRNGTLWLGTEWGGFGPFVNGKFKPCWPAQRHWHRVGALQELPDGSMVAGIQDNSPTLTGVFRVTGGKVIPPQTFSGVVSGFALSPQGLVTAMQNGAFTTGPDGKLSPYGNAKAFFGKTVTAVAVDHDNAVWFGTEHDGLIRFQNGSYRFFTTRDGLTSNRVNCLYADREGCLWIGSNNGVVKWDGKRFISFSKVDGLYASDVNAIAEDREGNLWVSSGFGLNRFAATKLVPYSLSRDSVAAHVYGIDGAPNGVVWCASDLGLWRLLPSGARYCPLPAGTPRSYADGVCAAPNGSLYLWFKDPSNMCELYQARPSGDGLVSMRPIIDASTHAPMKTPIAKAVADKDGITLFAGGEMTRVLNDGTVHRKLVDTTWEFDVVEDGPDSYWVGCMNGLVHVRAGISTRMNDGLPPGTHVLSIDATDPKCLWLATDKGIARFANGKSTLFDASVGLPDTNLFQIERDSGGMLWLGCLHGIFTVRIADLEAYADHKMRKVRTTMYSAADGIRSYFDLFSTAKTPDGRLWFGGETSVTMVDPEHVAVNNFPPPVTVESASMDDTGLATNAVTTVRPGDGRLHVSFAALSFAAPEQVRFRYRLDGFDDNWVESTRRVVDYTNLPPGFYRFEVTACNNDGIWNPVGASISFRLQPHYYQTLWFKSIVVLAVLALLAVAFAWRMRRVVRHNADLERLIAERTAELRMSNDQLQAAQEELTAQNHELETARDFLEERVAERTRELENAYDRTIEGWSYVMDLRDKETEGHSRRVTDVTVRMAEAIGLAGDDLDNVRRGALLHDIGKMGVPDGVLLKPGPLNDEEWKVMRMHPVYAYEILSQIDYLKAAVDIPWCHHEKWDGTGYPRGLAGEEIPLAARMFCIVDVWDALRSDRPYRKGWPEEKVFDHLRSLAGTHFEPRLVELFFVVMAHNRDLRGAAEEANENVDAKAA